jgi:hypothetical protein
MGAATMKIKIAVSISLIIVLLLVCLPGCKNVTSSINGSGKVIDQDLNIRDFSTINIKGGYGVTIKKSDQYKVTVSLDDNLFKRLQISVERKTLKMGIEAPATFFPTALKVEISMPEMLGLNLSGGAKANFSGFDSRQDFSLFMTDKSILEGSLIASDLTLNLSGGAKAALAGSAIKLDLISKDGSVAEMSKFEVLQGQVRLNESSEAVLNVTGLFDVELKDKSKLYFSGRPIFTNTLVTGGSTMTMIQK